MPIKPINTIYYLAQKYSGMESKAYENAVKWVYELRKKKITVFSPILHTHKYHEELPLILDPPKFTRKFHPNNKVLPEFYVYLSKENYVEWDIELMEGWINWDGYFMDKPCPEGPHEVYDSGLIILFAGDCYHYYNPNVSINFMTPDEFADAQLPENLTALMWDSKGAEKEFLWAKEYHVRCLKLEPFLEGKEADI